jgi:RNA-directed DNA polymerase
VAERIQKSIEQEARKLVVRHERYLKDLHDELKRRGRRTGETPDKKILRPSYWDLARGFNPYLVRSSSKRIAHAIQTGLRERSYAPRPAVSYSIKKNGAERRHVSVFQVADSAISRMVFHSILNKNRSRFSAYSFAYRSDLTVHDAIQHIAADIRGKPRIFVAEYDFRKYFDSIFHEHVWRTLHDQRFLLTDVEGIVLRGFLSTPTLPFDQYSEESQLSRDRGVPQGTSVSLLLANVAAWPLDRALERLGVGFARYADDTLIWSHDYARICEAAETLNEAARAIGAELNLEKSEGISILAPANAPAEMKAKAMVEFVGYSFSGNHVSFRKESLHRMRERLSYLVYSNLLLDAKRGKTVRDRVEPPVDRDYVVMIYQLRRYLYGDLNEEKLRRYLGRSVPRIHYKGKMAFYPLVDDEEELRRLDGWLLHTVFTSLRKRERLLRAAGFEELPPPHGLQKQELTKFMGQSSGGATLDLRLPSFARMGELLKKASTFYGPNAIGHPQSNQYYLGY